jgi:hypothetical protein
MQSWYRKAGALLVGVLLLAAGGARAADAVLRNGDNYRLSAEVLPGSGPGNGRLALTLVPKGTWKITLEAPLKVGLEPPAGLELDSKALKKDDLKVKTKERARFELGFRAAPSSRHKLKLQFDFVLCDDKVCQKKKFEVEHLLVAP